MMLLIPLMGWSQPAEKAIFSAPGGFYEQSFSLEIFPFYANHHIRYTTNGNQPTAQSTLYSGPLWLDERLYSASDIYTIQVAPEEQMYYPDSVNHCIVIRAAVFDENENRISEVSTNSYFIHSLGCDTHGLPVLSLCSDSLGLFDYQNGIFVPGAWLDSLNPNWSGNYYQQGSDWERLANIEFYELDNTGINQQAGLRTHGGNGRRLQQKAMKLFARQQYGISSFTHRFFTSLESESFKRLVLKPFASSWDNSGVNDHISNALASMVNVEALASRPSICFLNGEYWGIYYVHECPDEHYLQSHLGVDLDNLNIVESWNPTLEHGSLQGFLDLYHWVENHDLNDDDAFVFFESLVDVDCFIDYCLLELFLENNDWPANNMRCWQSDNGRWRWIFYDGDACLRWMTFYVFDNLVYEGPDLWPSSTKATLFFRKLWANEQFRHRFVTRFDELLNDRFQYSTTRPFYDSIKEAIMPEIPSQSQRFGIPLSIEEWMDAMLQVQWFLMHRVEYIYPVIGGFTASDENNSYPMACYPNPFSGTLRVDVDGDVRHTVDVRIYDLSGQGVYNHIFSLCPGLNTLTIVPELLSGIYTLRIDDFSQIIICE